MGRISINSVLSSPRKSLTKSGLLFLVQPIYTSTGYRKFSIYFATIVCQIYISEISNIFIKNFQYISQLILLTGLQQIRKKHLHKISNVFQLAPHMDYDHFPILWIQPNESL